VAAIRMQIVPAWPPVACKFPSILFMLHATGGHASTIYMQLAASCMQTSVDFIHVACNRQHSGKIYMDWPPVACKVLMHQRPVACKAASFLQARCENNYLNKKMKTPLKNLRIYATHVLAKAYPLTLCMARSNLVRQFLYHKMVLQHLVTGLGNHKQKGK
jgi:hypothetical protein